MDGLLTLLPPSLLIFAALVTFLAGFIKGAIGFAMPLVMISGMSILIEPRLVVAGIVLPIVVSNGLQIMRSGWSAAREAAVEFRRYIFIVCVMIFVVTQFVILVPTRAMFFVLGVPTVALSIVQLAGWRFSVPAGARSRFDWGIGAIAGMLGGFAGTWGPPTVLYLLALNTPKAKQMAVQGVVYGLASMTLLAGHLQSGLLNRDTVPLSAALLVPATLGMWCGFRLGDRMDQEKFRRVTLIVLVLAGLNLVRRGVTG